jgi:hypothetical protein
MDRIEIDEATLKSTTRCERNFSCLSSNDRTVCPPEHLIQNDVLFVKSGQTKMCPYLVHFGFGYVCSCPVRKGIYKRYRI